MPKSKRNKIVHLTQVKKKGKDHKEDLLKQLEQLVASFKRVYIFDFEEAKSDRIMALRLKVKSIGKIFSGKNSLVSLTLKTIGSRTHVDYDDLIRQVSGHRGLLFTDASSSELIELLDKEQPEFCKKLLGYSELVPDNSGPAVSMELDDDDDVAPENDKSKKLAEHQKKQQLPRKSKSRKNDKKKGVRAGEGDEERQADDGGAAAAIGRREVKFVKL